MDEWQESYSTIISSSLLRNSTVVSTVTSLAINIPFGISVSRFLSYTQIFLMVWLRFQHEYLIYNQNTLVCFSEWNHHYSLKLDATLSSDPLPFPVQQTSILLTLWSYFGETFSVHPLSPYSVHTPKYPLNYYFLICPRYFFVSAIFRRNQSDDATPPDPSLSQTCQSL